MTDSTPLVVAIAADHRGLALKDQLKQWFDSRAIEIQDFGATERNEQDDYPDLGAPAARFVAEDPAHRRGVLICGSGQGMAIVANKVPGIRAIVVSRLDHFTNDEDANVLALSADHLDRASAEQAISEWLARSDVPLAERHQRRIEKIMALER